MTAERVVVRAICSAVALALGPYRRVVLAVSGGIDSMVLLDAAASGLGLRGGRRLAAGDGRRRLAGLSSPPWPARSENRTPPVPTPGAAHPMIVATFDHATGAHSRKAALIVERRAAELGLGFVSARAEERARTEAEWREQRWEFLRRVAAERDAVVATAHNMNDQIETVFMRILRDAGPRGLSGLFADTDVLRPLVPFRRAEIEEYARAKKLDYVSDPSNVSRAHLRNRVRLDLLPAIEAMSPEFGADLLRISHRALEWRRQVVDVVDALPAAEHADGSVFVARSALENLGSDELRALWPEIAARAGITMDRRGTRRVASFTIEGSTGGSIQLSGGGEVVRTREHFVVRRNHS